jgi:hypothetical protein
MPHVNDRASAALPLVYIRLPWQVTAHCQVAIRRRKRGKVVTKSLWTDSGTEWLRELYEKGRSNRQIAEELGVSRSAVAGKLQRLGLFGGRKRMLRPNIDVSKTRQKRKQGEPVPFLDRSADQCAAVLDGRGKNGLPFVCGQPVYRRSWCREHHEKYINERTADGKASPTHERV